MKNSAPNRQYTDESRQAAVRQVLDDDRVYRPNVTGCFSIVTYCFGDRDRRFRNSPGPVRYGAA